MNKYFLFLLLCFLPQPVRNLFAQVPAKRVGDFIESTSYNESKRGASRSLQYRPDGEDFVCVNGVNRFTRALYARTSPFRLETSDRPVFAAYDKRNSKNIRFRLLLGGTSVALDSIAFCEARYTPGRRSYRLTDPAWGKGALFISALPFPDKDGAIWKITSTDMPADARLICLISEIKSKHLNRNGDMGADPPDSFEAPEHPLLLHQYELPLTGYLILENLSLRIPEASEGSSIYAKAEHARAELASRIKINTPDAYFNTLGGALAVATNAIWDGEVWLHGAVGWRMPLSGWRAAYTGDALGWHDRARKHFDAYAASQVTNVPQTISHPAQDPDMNLARSIKKWGTPQYSNGYICRNPHNPNQMHHYDMNLCYIDELLWHFNWTGDLAYARKMWPLLVRHLDWEKRNFDPDNDGLYDAYACIWASDALYYNSGAVTHSSAYNYRANKMVAEIAEKIGEDPSPYRAEAEKILKAMNTRLWIPSKGHWAEYQDFMGHKRLHENAAVWTIYHAIDSETADPFQAYQATRYVDTEIPHIPVRASGLKDEGYATISTTNWMPYSWSINNVAFAEVMHTSLSYWEAGRNDEAFKLLKSSVLDGMYLGDSPANFGQLSFYDAARGECYRDFGDAIGVASRAIVQGLFGIIPDALNGRLLIRPGFPAAWPYATFSTPDVSFDYHRKGNADVYKIAQHFDKPIVLELQIHARKDKVNSIRINGDKAEWKQIENSVGQPVLSIVMPAGDTYEIEIKWGGSSINTAIDHQRSYSVGDTFELALPQYTISKLYDPQGVFRKVRTQQDEHVVRGRITGEPGNHTLFAYVCEGDLSWWQPINITIKNNETPAEPAFKHVESVFCREVNMDAVFNASVTDIFRNEYLTPRSPYTTLQIPKQGIGEWCHPKMTAEIDDSGLRAKVRGGLLSTKLGVSFRTPAQGVNIAFTSLWDNYPDSLHVPLGGQASHAYLLMAGSTNHMQCHIANGIIRIHYTDGTSDTLTLINPENWCPIEQDFFVDNMAFKLNASRPYRLHLKTGIVSNNLEKELGIEGVYGRSIDGGAGILLDMPLNPEKELSYLSLETLSNDVVIGLMGITLQK
ncbi:DUF4450 domain-containing protein [uncultured Bacteroides sp.]|uniref:DUF4450 domain-containing protein n=1 Tax=uncultured Bacteroides sp. TaxID=162156 RepID=UPI002AA6C620|nr:DUF4450 domain-containing protein [uncultured Bacteroides sp.]